MSNSRIDRVYLNNHISEQLDHKFGCSTLPRRADLSSHAPLSFFRKGPSNTNNLQPENSTHTTINNNVLNHPDWPARVSAELQCISTQPGDFSNPFRRLVLLKRAMHTVSRNMTTEEAHTTAESTEDKLNCTLSFVRAAQQTNLNKMRRKALEYPYIATIVNPKDPNTCHRVAFNTLLDHAVQLSKQGIIEELHDIQATSEHSNDYHTTIRRKNVMAHIKRLFPGNCSSIGAVESPSGEYLTKPEQIGTALAQH